MNGLPSFLPGAPLLALMQLPNPLLLGALYALSEIFLGVTRRSGSETVSRDRRSLLILWAVIGGSLLLARVALSYPVGKLPHAHLCSLLGLILFSAGIGLRWWSIFYLGRFFTVDVAIAQKHELIDSGPYRLIRHPSYTGALMAFFGFGLALGNWLALLCLLIPTTGAFLWRMKVEERALTDALGDPYRNYTRRTKRLIPFVY